LLDVLFVFILKHI